MQRKTPVFSIIVPIGPGEDELEHLLTDLKLIPESDEVLLVYSSLVNSKRIKAGKAIIEKLELKCLVKWVESVQGRACQMNRGADQSCGKYLWFLHADSRLVQENYDALNKAIKSNPNALYFFSLYFRKTGVPAIIKLNELGSRLRSSLLGMPFGDQGFCLSRSIYNELGGYPEDVEYGEDHLLTWRSRQSGIKMYRVRSKLSTSARKYTLQGWLNLTLRYHYRWVKQAIPEFRTLLQSRGIL